MNPRQPPHLPVDLCRALQFAALLLLPAYAPIHSKAHGPRGASESTPYLVAVGAAPLLFREEAPPPNFAKRPPAGAPPTPAPDGADPARSATGAERPDVILAQPPPSSVSPGDPGDPGSANRNVNRPPPPAIIPDDLRPVVRPEDFLPYFQLPGSGQAPAGVRVIVPIPLGAPATAVPLPASSATFTQPQR